MAATAHVLFSPDLIKLSGFTCNTPKSGCGCERSGTRSAITIMRRGDAHPLGPQDDCMPEASGLAYLRDLPEAEFHVLDGGHWALETNLDGIARVDARLSRTHAYRCLIFA